MIIYGTRPEAIKMAPLIGGIARSRHLTSTIVVTGQHREMLDQVNDLFGIHPAYDLDIIQPKQSLEQITVRSLAGLGEVIRTVRPDMVAVQGDTTTSFVSGLAAFYEQVPVVHVEAGLRTSNRYSPFPEEMNRRLTSQLASLHLAPTPTARQNLLAENVEPESIVVTGNTVIDALLDVVALRVPYSDGRLERLTASKMVLITAHRRESWGEPMARSAQAIADLARRFDDVVFVLPAHLNPIVRDILLPPLGGLANVLITDPLPYGEFARLMKDSYVILTDSGGVQEEGPSLGKPVLVMRESTERPEAVTAGTARLVGTDRQLIVAELSRLLTDERYYATMANAVNPYGDGQAGRRSVQSIEHFFGLADRSDDFAPTATER
jgi:UDP-N-acetylglucosamine 2-epimerase (non-hydrolysing)